MLFVLGYIAGIATCIFLFVVLIYFKKVIEQKTTIIEKTIEAKGPRPRGFIIEPKSEAEEAREEIIERNRALGRDTRINELQ